jgi:dTDP-4-dehydrorhamnose reductase
MGGLLVTGGKGQLGKAFGRLVPDAVLVDIDELDICDRVAVGRAVEDLQPAVVVHGAAWTQVDAAESDPGGARRVNVEGTRNVAEAAAKAGALLVYVSTDYVFPGEHTGPYRESDATGPRSVYGQTKLDGEAEASAFGRHLIVRTSWVFGDGHNFIRSILRAAATRDELTVVDDQIGRPTYALDLAGGLIGLADAGAEGLFHLTGGGEPGSWADLAEFALRHAGSATTVRRISTADYLRGQAGPVAPRPAWSVLDCTKAAGFGVQLRPWPHAVAAFLDEEHPPAS